MATNIIDDIESSDSAENEPLAASTPNLSTDITDANNVISSGRPRQTKRFSWSLPFLSCFKKFSLFNKKYFERTTASGVNFIHQSSSDVGDIFDSFFNDDKSATVVSAQPPRNIPSSNLPRISETYSFLPVERRSAEIQVDDAILLPSSGRIGERKKPSASAANNFFDRRILVQSTELTDEAKGLKNVEIGSVDRRVITLRQLEVGLESLGITSTVETWKLVYGSFNVTSIDQPVPIKDSIEIVKQFFSLELHLGGITEDQLLQSLASVRLSTDDKTKSKMKSLEKENRKLRESLKEEITVRSETEKILLKIRKVVQDIIRDCEKLKRDFNSSFNRKTSKNERSTPSTSNKKNSADQNDVEQPLKNAPKSSHSKTVFWV